jgi:hypothetical protein
MLPALTGLLSAATEAQGDQPPEHKEMKAKVWFRS